MFTREFEYIERREVALAHIPTGGLCLYILLPSSATLPGRPPVIVHPDAIIACTSPSFLLPITWAL